MIRRTITILIALTAALVAAVFLLALVLGFPPAPLAVQPNSAFDDARLARSAAGASHIHTNRSDGAGTVDSVARAAARPAEVRHRHRPWRRHTRAGSAAVPVRRAGSRRREISTTGGHVLAIGMARRRFRSVARRATSSKTSSGGGLAIAAHPGSQKPELRWDDWQAPFDGLEWINSDSEWRDESRRPIARASQPTGFAGRRRSRRSIDRARSSRAGTR
jgi:hypothetical protein